MMEMTNPSNDLGLLNAYVSLSFFYMFFQSRGMGPTILDVSGMLTNPLINRVTSLIYIGNPTRGRDNLNTFHIFKVHKAFYIS